MSFGVEASGGSGLLLLQASVMRHDFTLRKVERHLQGHQDGELERYQLPPADPETLLQLLHETQTKQKRLKRVLIMLIIVIDL